MKGKEIFALVFSLMSLTSLAQDIQYSQYYANPIYLNPAMTGSSGMTRFGVNFRNQWPGLDQTFLAYTAFADHFEERLNSGFGIIVQVVLLPEMLLLTKWFLVPSSILRPEPSTQVETVLKGRVKSELAMPMLAWYIMEKEYGLVLLWPTCFSLTSVSWPEEAINFL